MGYPSPDNSPVYWEVQRDNGTWMSLHTYAWSVKSFGGRRFFAGAKRGEDIQLPHRRGRIYMPKTRESQVYDINMWVFPTNADGSRDITKTVEQKAHENWRKIVDAVDQEGQFRLRKRWYKDNAVKENFTSDVESGIAMAEFLDGSGPDSDDGRGYYINLSFALADPYFYGNQLVDGYTAASKASSATSLVAGTNTVTVDGDAPTDHVWLSLTDMGNSNPRIVFPDGNWIQIASSSMTSTIQNRETIIDLNQGLGVQTSLQNYLGGTYSNPTYINGYIRRNPYFQNWPTLVPKGGLSSQLTVTGSGTIKLLYDPAYR